MQIETIIQAVSRRAGVPVAALLEWGKSVETAEFKMLAQFIAYVHFEYTAKQVSEFFKLKDHTVVFHAVSVIGVRLGVYEDLSKLHSEVMQDVWRPAA